MEIRQMAELVLVNQTILTEELLFTREILIGFDDQQEYDGNTARQISFFLFRNSSTIVSDQISWHRNCLISFQFLPQNNYRLSGDFLSEEENNQEIFLQSICMEISLISDYDVVDSCTHIIIKISPSGRIDNVHSSELESKYSDMIYIDIGLIC